jgi:hypothetical protein
MACSVLGNCGAVVGGGGPAQVLPLFAVEVLQCACRAEAVRFDVCAGEADAATAALARELRCCALSQDSDFFVFDIPAGALHVSAVCRGMVHSLHVCRAATRTIVGILLRQPLARLWNSCLGYCPISDLVIDAHARSVPTSRWPVPASAECVSEQARSHVAHIPAYSARIPASSAHFPA